MFNILFILLSTGQADEYCRVVSLQGGAAMGAFQAGAFKAMVEMLEPQDIEWDIVTGISSGAVNTGIISRYAPGEEKQMAEELENYYLSIKDSSELITRCGIFDFITYLFCPAYVNDDGLKQKLKQAYANRPLKRMANVGAVNYGTGQYESFDESLSPEDFYQAVLCSASWPPVLPNVHFRGNTYADGGVFIGMDVFTGIERCYEKTKDYSKIIADMLLVQYNAPLPDIKNMNTTVINNVSNAISGYAWTMATVTDAYDAFPEVNFRYLIQPAAPITDNPFDFSPNKLKYMVDRGYEDTKAYLENYERQDGKDKMRMGRREGLKVYPME